MRDFNWDSLFVLLGIMGGLAMLSALMLKVRAITETSSRARTAAIADCIKSGRPPLECKSAHYGGQ